MSGERLTLDLARIADEWLQQCGACDAGFPAACVCSQCDPRATIFELVREVEHLRAESERLTACREEWNHESDYTVVRWAVVRRDTRNTFEGGATMGWGENEAGARADYEQRVRTLHRGEQLRLERTTTRERTQWRTEVIVQRTKPVAADGGKPDA